MVLPDITINTFEQKKKQLCLRDNTPVEKNIILTEQKLIMNEQELQKKLSIWSSYPDIWADEILIPTTSSFKWKFYQRIMCRNLARIPLNHTSMARGVSKTFVTLFMTFHRCIFAPGSEIAFAAPTKTQAAQIAKQTVKDLLNKFPLLQNELKGDIIGGKDYFEVRFKNGSKIEITSALDSTRGRRFDEIVVDEARDFDGNDVNGILVPTVTKIRSTSGAGKLNPYEIHQIQNYSTSASSKSSYNYEKVLDLLMKMIINPRNACVMGLDYKVPVIEGIYPSSFVRDIKMDPTMNEQLFAREFLSIYTAENDESWFNFNKLNIHRKIVNAEWGETNSKSPDVFYITSTDVGRIHDNTIVVVFKVYPNDGKFKTKVVNIITLGKNSKGKHFYQQAIDLKKIIAAYNSKDNVIDTNGLGVGLADLMIQTQYGVNGEEYAPLGFYNDNEYKAIQPKDAPCVLNSFKANHKINSEMFGNCYTRIDAGLVDFLIKEQDARSKLLATKKGQMMSLEEKTKFLMPYEMTTKLFEEIGNLKLKRTGNGTDIVLEPINSRFPDDRFSSLCIGLRRIKELEEEYTKKYRKKLNRKLVFFS